TWQRMQSQIVDANLSLPVEIDLYAIGEHWQVRYRQHPGTQVRVTAGGRLLTVYHAGDDESDCREALRRWLARCAREHLGVRAQRLGADAGFSYRRLQIRGQKSRWGSCSSNGTLSLNYKLLFLKPELVRYLLVHELAHTRVLDHSTRFWKLVARHEPRWREFDKELGEAWRDVPAWVELK
ncbi:MAG: M48 family metallopeptidase, partial [Gammaproteobacteria bacterium]